MQEYVSLIADSLFGTLTGDWEVPFPAFPSFIYKNVPFNPAKWERTMRPLEKTEGYEKYETVFRSPDRLLKLRLTTIVYSEYPVVEWLPELVAATAAETGIVENFMSLDLKMTFPAEPALPQYHCHRIRVRRNLGSKCNVNDFTPQDVELNERHGCNSLLMDTDEGRSSAAWLPFFGVDFDEEFGFNVAIGWSGAWKAQVAIADGQLSVQAGMMHTHFRLLAGEIIRQPSIFIMLRDGMTVRECQNLHRQFMLDFHSPKNLEDKNIKPPLCVSVWGGQKNEKILQVLDRLQERKLSYDVLWMDAGWYGEDREVSDSEYHDSDWSRTVGNWRVNQVPHPGGLRPIADKAHALGMKFMLWVEIQRAMDDSPVVQEHPEWILRSSDKTNKRRLLNFGRQDVREWAFEVIRRLVVEEGVDYYREDFNFNTLPYWKAMDAPDRQGIAEAQFIAGFYEFWDMLRRMFPDMLIDNCASGGRRLDFETASRSICLWRSDLVGRPWYDASPVQQVQLRYLSEWLPLFGGGVAVEDGNDYSVLAAMSPALAYGCGYDVAELDAAWEADILECCRRMRDCFQGDFHPLCDTVMDWSKLYGYQLHDARTGGGCVVVFRHLNVAESRFEARLQGIEPRAKYNVTDKQGERRQLRGAELVNFSVTLPKEHSASVLFYERANKR